MNIERLHDIKKINVLLFGDFMVDKYINGTVSRISPEAPVPIINVDSEFLKLGGAGNVVNNIVSLGGKVTVLGCIGNDNAGDFITDSFIKKQVNINYFKQDKDIKTIIKTRITSKKQQFIRIDSEEKKELPKDYQEFIKNHLDEIFENIDVLVISDYAKGVVTNNIAQVLIKKANSKNIPIIVDPKGNDYNKYAGATICTPNLKELNDVFNKKIDTEEDIQEYGAKLCQDIDLKYLILTRSEKGISLITKNEKKEDFPAIEKDVIDVSGAGDTVVAMISLLIALGYPLYDICKIANVAASIVVSKFGTATVSFNELISTLSKTSEFKLQTIESLKYIVQDLKDKNKKVVFTNGCFDMLHVGHLKSFKEAKKYGDVLIVAINSDKSVKENKGDLRPIIPQEDRIELVSALECVDYVILMEDKTPANIIENLKPDICIKGEDWKNKEVPEKKIIDSYNGKLEFIKLEEGKSTSKIIEKVIKAYGEK